MFASLLLSSLLAAEPAVERPRLTVLDLPPSPSVEASLLASLSESIAIEASQIGTFEVSSQKALTTMLSLERQKSLLGCAEESKQCMLELAEAVGARFVIAGSLVRIGATWQLNLQMLDTRRGSQIGHATRLANELEAIRAQLPWALAEVTNTPPPRAPSRVFPYSLMIGGGVAMAAGGLLFLQAFVRERSVLANLNAGGRLDTSAFYAGEAREIGELRIIGAIALGVGVALLTTGLVINPKSDAVVRTALVPGPGGVALVGVFP